MEAFKKKILLYSLTGIALISSVALPLSSCRKIVNKDYDNFEKPSNPNDENNYKGIISKEITDSLKELDNETLVEINSNIFDLESSKEEFLNSLNIYDSSIFKEYNIKNAYLDIYNFIYNLYLSSESNIDVILNESLKEKSLGQNENSKTFFELDLKININNNTNNVQSFKLINNEIFIEPNSQHILSITIPKQEIKFDLNIKNMMQWFVNDVAFQFGNNEKIILNNFSFSQENKSYVIPYKVKNIFSIDENNLDEKKFNLDDLSEAKVKKDIEQHFINSKNISLNYLFYTNEIITILAKDDTLDVFLHDVAPIVSDILINEKIITSDLKPLVIDLFNKNISLLTIIHNNKKAIIDFIVNSIPDLNVESNIIESIVNKIRPDMNDDDKNFFIDIIKNISMPENYQELILQIINELFANKDVYSFIEFLINKVLEPLEPQLPQNEIVINTLNFIKHVFKKDNVSLKYQNIITILLGNKTITSAFVKSILNIVGMGNMAITFDNFYTNNENLNIEKFKSFLSSVLIPTTKFLSNQSNYEVISKFKNNNDKEEFSYNSINKSVSYIYELKFKFLNNHKIDLNKIYDILPNNISIDGTNLPFSTVRSAGYLPDYIEIGVNDMLEIEFSSNEQKLILLPKKIQNGKGYYFNYSIPYNAKVVFNMPSAYNSIFTQYQYQIFLVTTLPWSFISSVIPLFMMIDYNFFGVISVLDKSNINVNHIEKLPSLNKTFKWNDLSTTELNDLANYLENKNSLTFTVKDKKGKVHTMVGQKPYLIESKRNEFINRVLTLGSDFENMNEDEKPIIVINPHVNGKISALGQLLDFSLRIIQVDVYFPNKRIIDLNNSNLNNNEFVYSNHFSKTFVLQ